MVANFSRYAENFRIVISFLLRSHVLFMVYEIFAARNDTGVDNADLFFKIDDLNFLFSI